MSDRSRDGYALSTDPARVDVDLVHRWLAEESYWAAGRAHDVVAPRRHPRRPGRPRVVPAPRRPR